MQDKAPKRAGTRRRCRPLRGEKQGQLYFVTGRVVENRFWLHPILSCCLQPLNHRARRICQVFERKAEREVRKLVDEANKRMGPCQAPLTVPIAKLLLKDMVGACLARAQQHCRENGSGEIELFGFVAMSNHVHLVVRTHGKNLAAFMRYFNSALASGMNYLTGKRGQLFGRRYDAQPILDDDAASGRIAYCIDNPRAAGLVDNHNQWPGQLLCFGLGDTDTPTFKFFNRMKWHKAKRPKNITPYIEDVTLTLSPLPHLNALDRDAYRRNVEGWLTDLQAETDRMQPTRSASESKQARDKRAQRRIAKVIALPIGHRPDRAKHKRRPYAFGSADKVAEHRYAMGVVMSLHQESSRRFRTADRNVAFPDGTYAPPITSAA